MAKELDGKVATITEVATITGAASGAGSVSPGPVISALLADWPEDNLKKARESGCSC